MQISKPGSERGLDDFGGDYGSYLQLLKGNSVLEELGPAAGGGTGDIEKGQVGRLRSMFCLIDEFV